MRECVQGSLQESHGDAQGGRESAQAGTRWLESVERRCQVLVAGDWESGRHRQQVAGKVTGITRKYPSTPLRVGRSCS